MTSSVLIAALLLVAFSLASVVYLARNAARSASEHQQYLVQETARVIAASAGVIERGEAMMKVIVDQVKASAAFEMDMATTHHENMFNLARDVRTEHILGHNGVAPFTNMEGRVQEHIREVMENLGLSREKAVAYIVDGLSPRFTGVGE